jgi:cob(I)alamin adenosyltransferase
MGCGSSGQQDALKDTPRQYLNRLSDLLFVLSRVPEPHGMAGTTY